MQFADLSVAAGEIVASSMQAGLRVAGTAEFAGLDAPVNKRRAASLKRLAKAMLPDFDTQAKQSWTGNRPSLPDGLPIIREFAQHKWLFGAFGHARHGLMMAPKTGELVADLVAGHRTNLNPSPFAPDRFD